MGPGRTTSNERATTRTARRLTSWAVLLLAVTALAGCGGQADTAAADENAPKVKGGAITIGMDQQPSCLNTMLVCGGMAATTMVTSTVFDSFIGVDGEGERFPLMATEIPTTDNGGVVETDGGGMDVTVHIRPEARWSDGKPVTCADAKFTIDTILDDRWLIGSRIGYELVKDVSCPDAQTAVYHFKERYAPFLNVVGGAPLPKHALAGKDFNTFWNELITVGSGPFVFDHWSRSVEIVVKRNPNYWNAGKDALPWLSEINYKFIADTNTLKIQLRTGEVDLINPPPDSTLEAELKTFPRAGFQIEPGIYWEQLAFNTSRAPTNDPDVRQAIAFAVDRQELTDVVLRKQVGVLNSTLLEGQKDYFVPLWEDVKPDQEKVTQLLEKAGYKRNGTYFEKGGKPLTVKFKSTAGNNLRLKVAQVLQQNFKKFGINMVMALEPPEVFFGQSTVQGNFDIALWAWSSGTDPSQRTLFSCDQIPTEKNDYEGNNYYRYCNEEVTELLKKADVTPDVGERARMTKRVQELMRADMPILPIFQRPETIAYGNQVQGIDNSPLGGVAWNSFDWSVTAK